MKRCPECRRDYYDDTLLYCLDDGNALLEGPASDEPKTAILAEADTLSDAPAIPVASNHPEADLEAKTADPKHRTDHSGSFLDSAGRNKSRAVIIGFTCLVILTAGGYWAYRFFFDGKARREPFKSIKLSRVTNEGNVDSVTISPDGKYIAYVTVDGDSRTLWTKHLATNSRVQIASVTNVVDLYSTGFSPDGNYVLYGVQGQNAQNYDVYQVPVLGGVPRKILSNVLPVVSFSPDNKHIAYSRGDPSTNDISVLIANADGTDEHPLVVRKIPDLIGIFGASWSPDGTTLATDFDAEGPNNAIVAGINVTDGSLTPLNSKKFGYIGIVKWLMDGSGVVFVGREKPGDENQVWFTSYPNGEVRQLTHDLNSYQIGSLEAAAENKTLVALQDQTVPVLYVAETDKLNALRRISTGNNGVGWLNWDKGGRLFYATWGNQNWVVDTNASTPRVIAEGDGVGPMIVTPDGSYSIFVSGRSGSDEIWRRDMDGSNPKQLTTGTQALYSYSVSSDGQWIVYSTVLGNIWKFSIDGGIGVVFV